MNFVSKTNQQTKEKPMSADKSDKPQEYYFLNGKTHPVKKTFANDEEAIAAAKRDLSIIRVQHLGTTNHIWERPTAPAAKEAEAKS